MQAPAGTLGATGFISQRNDRGAAAKAGSSIGLSTLYYDNDCYQSMIFVYLINDPQAS